MRVEPNKQRKKRRIQNIHSSQSEPIQQSTKISFKRGLNAGSKYATIFVKLSFEFQAKTIESERKSGLFKIFSIVLLFCMHASYAFRCS